MTSTRFDSTGRVPAGAALEQSSQQARSDRRLDVLTRVRRAVDERATFPHPLEESLLEQPVQRRHDRRVGDGTSELRTDLPDANTIAPPDDVHDLTFKVSQRRSEQVAVAGFTESAQPRAPGPPQHGSQYKGQGGPALFGP